PSFYYVQFLAGDTASPFLRSLSGLMLFASIVVFPLVLLCWMQARFLALHVPGVTVVHRLTVIADVALLLAFLWRPVSVGGAQRLRRDAAVPRPLRTLTTARALVVATCLLVLLFTVTAGIPQRPPEQRLWIGPWSESWFNYRTLDLHERMLTAE